jgi:cytochrome bd-type quinol oxidase subunit 2
MRIALRFLRLLALIVWLGGLLFFPVVAQVAFSSLSSTHDAGSVVGESLLVLHGIGLVCGITLLLTTVILARTRRSATFCGIAAVMLALTAYSQYSIMPRMERDRINATSEGSQITQDCTSPECEDFNRLHPLSEHIEEAVMLGGLALTVLMAME